MMQETGQEFVLGEDEELTQSTIMLGSTWVLYQTFMCFRGSQMHLYFVLFCLKLLTIQISFIKCKEFLSIF